MEVGFIFYYLYIPVWSLFLDALPVKETIKIFIVPINMPMT